MEATFGFLDLVKASVATEARDGETAEDVTERFAELARGALLGGTRVVKTDGDPLLVTSLDPDLAIQFIQRLLTAISVEAKFPRVRGGFQHGDAAPRGANMFGTTVELAAAIASRAREGQILASAAVAAAGRSAGIPVSSVGSVMFKNVRAPVELFALHVMAGRGAVVD